MDKWTVYVEIDGETVWEATYGDIGSAQMMQEAKRLEYYWHDRIIGVNGPIKVVVGIEQS